MYFRFTFLFIVTFIFTLFGGLLGGVATAHAQGYNEYSIIASPLNPAPGQTVNLELKSTSSDVNKAEIAWYNGNKLLQKGIGLTKITLVAPTSGSSAAVEAIVEVPNKVAARVSLTLRVGEVNIAWETDGYVPPFYRGRAPYTYQSNLKLVALPNLYDASGNYILPSDLTYKWKRDSTVLGSNSGFNKQSLVLKGEIVPRPITVSVEVESRSGTVKGQGSISIDATDTQILLYENDPLYGPLYNIALGNKFTLSSERRVIAEPYFYSVGEKTSPRLRYTWSINNLEAQDLQNSTGMTIRPKGDTEGSSLISVRIDNLADILQSASKGLQVYFSKSTEQQLPIF